MMKIEIPIKMNTRWLLIILYKTNVMINNKFMNKLTLIKNYFKKTSKINKISCKIKVNYPRIK